MAGLSRKYKGQADNRRAEYFLSENSKKSIQAILEANEEIVADKSYYNFASMAKSSGALKETQEAQDLLKIAIKTSKNNTKDLYKAVNNLHVSYFLSLIEQLSITAKILDSDGD